MESVLLHCCCGPCAIYIANWFRDQDIPFSAFWYNPNIHPFTEHQKRLDSMQTLSQNMEFELMIDEGYEMIDYFRSVVGHEVDRCADCYRLRLEETAQVARQQGFETFSTTLLISPYQKHELLREIGEEVASENGVGFYYRDFRDHFREGRQMASEMGLYLQKYCGCVYSEWERFGKIEIG